MKTLKKLPYLLVFVFALLVAGCTEVAVGPVGTDDDDDPIIIGPGTKP